MTRSKRPRRLRPVERRRARGARTLVCTAGALRPAGPAAFGALRSAGAEDFGALRPAGSATFSASRHTVRAGSSRGGPPPGQAAPARGSPVGPEGRRGFGLLLALLVILALGTLGTGLLFVSTQEARVAAALVHTVRARAGAESAVRAVLAGWRTSAYRSIEPGAPGAAPAAAGTLAPDVAYDARVERLAAGLFLIRGEARSGPEAGPSARASVGLLVRGLLPADFAPDLAAALSAVGPVEVLPGGVVDGTGTAGPPERWGPDLCPPDSILGLPPGPRPGVLLPEDAPAPAGAVMGAPPVARDPDLADSTALAGLGPLGLADLAALADRTEAGAVVAAPRVAAGECDTGVAGNWGDPADPAAPCGGYFPLIFAPGDLALSGAGQGVLVVQGDLALEPGAVFHGAVLVTGRVTVPEGAIVSGAVRAGGASVAGAVRFDPCALGRALGSAPGLDRPLRPAGRSWVPVF